MFRTVVRNNLRMTLNTTLSVDATLEIGGVEETVAIAAAAPVVDVRTTTTAVNFTEELPPVASVSRACARDHRPSPATGGTADGPRPGYRQPAFAATDPDPSSRSTSRAGTGSTPCGRAAVPPAC